MRTLRIYFINNFHIYHTAPLVMLIMLYIISLKMLVTQLCPTLWDSMDCSPPSSSVRGILQARILERVAMHFTRGFSLPRDQSQVSCIAGRFFTIRVIRLKP